MIVPIMTCEKSTLVNSEKYLGFDVHQATISVAVMDSRGKVVMESILETKATTILDFLAGLRGALAVTFEEGIGRPGSLRSAQAACCQVVVCNPRKNALLKRGNKSDKIDPRQLAGLLRLNDLEPVYHGETACACCGLSLYRAGHFTLRPAGRRFSLTVDGRY